MYKIVLFFIFSVIIFSCTKLPNIDSDPLATKATKKLYQKMKTFSNEGVMIGYEDALAYGVGWWDEKDKCDMFTVSGEYPAIYGWDIGDIHKSENLDSVSFDKMIAWMGEVHKKGGINTVSWHMDNPITGASSWDKSQIAKDILPGGINHQKFTEKLDLAAAFFQKCKVNNELIPILFRPFHEHNGDWFWWGKGNTSEEDYIALYRFVADYFKEKHQIHHLMYAFSPDRSRIMNPSDSLEYLYAYPGDNYVDLLGLDNYADMRISDNDSINHQSITNFVKSLEMLTDVAEQKHKISALTETGSMGIKDDDWFTTRLYDPLMSSKKAQRISYILFWRNHSIEHHFMVYPGHNAAADFRAFVNKKEILTLTDLKK